MGDDQPKQHEAITLNASRVLAATGVVVAMLAAALVVSGGMMRWFAGARAPEPTAPSPATWPRPSASAGVEPNQAVEMAQLRRRNERWLSEYRWVEGQQQQVARVPIERAMELLAKQKLTVRWDQPGTDEEQAP